MSRPTLYATLAVLFAILIGTSYALNKQTEPPKPTPADMPPEQQAQMRKGMQEKQRMMMEQEKNQRKEMTTRMKKQAEEDKKKAVELASLGVKAPKSSGVDISDKWFKETPDGMAGIQQAIKEKEIVDKVTAAHAASTPHSAKRLATPPAMPAP